MRIATPSTTPASHVGTNRPRKIANAMNQPASNVNASRA